MSDQDEELLMVDTQNMSRGQFMEHLQLIKERGQFYRNENTHLEELFERLRLFCKEDGLKLCTEGKESLNSILAMVDDESIPPENLREHYKYLIKIKSCISHYSSLNSTVTIAISELKSQLDSTRKSADVAEDYGQTIQKLQEKVKKYEKDMLKFTKKHPFLNDPEYNLLDIGQQVNTLRALKEETELLLKHLEVYQNLKPSITEASQQLRDLKEQAKAMNY